MSEDQQETQNPVPEEISELLALQVSTEPASISPSTSTEVAMPPVAPEVPPEAESAITVNNDIPEMEPVEDTSTQTAQIENPSSNEPVSETSAQPTAQIPVNEPFAKLTLLAKAREMIQFRKRKKLEKIMGMFLKQASITNDEVEKLLHVSDATATRYLSQLEKEGKITQVGRTGKSVSYSRI